MSEFISRIEESCGAERQFIVLFKRDKASEAINKILSKSKVIQSISGILFKCSFKGREFTLFRAGRVVLKGFKEVEEAESFLNQLLSS